MSTTNEQLRIAVQQKIAEVLSDDSPLQRTYTEGSDLGQFIEHTLLKPDATSAQIDALCDEAIQHYFKSCCVSGSHVQRVARRLRGSRCVPCVVVGFPLGASKSSVKAFEAQEAVRDGANEVDMVINIGALKSHDYALVLQDIQHVVHAANANANPDTNPDIHRDVVPVKVILETALLSDEEKIAGAYLAAEAGALFVKTCTGFAGGGGATAGDVALMKRTVGYKPGVKVKASGGIRTTDKCVELLRAGAGRIGTSSGVAIVGGG